MEPSRAKHKNWKSRDAVRWIWLGGERRPQNVVLLTLFFFYFLPLLISVSRPWSLAVASKMCGLSADKAAIWVILEQGILLKTFAYIIRLTPPPQKGSFGGGAGRMLGKEAKGTLLFVLIYTGKCWLGREGWQRKTRVEAT